MVCGVELCVVCTVVGCGVVRGVEWCGDVGLCVCVCVLLCGVGVVCGVWSGVGLWGCVWSVEWCGVWGCVWGVEWCGVWDCVWGVELCVVWNVGCVVVWGCVWFMEYEVLVILIFAYPNQIYNIFNNMMLFGNILKMLLN